MKQISICLLLFLLFNSCSSKNQHGIAIKQTSTIDSASLPQKARHLKHLKVYLKPINPDTVMLKKLKTYGNNKNVTVGRMLGAVADTSGRVYIADLDQHNIHVFGPGGQFITNLGRSGRGPGEFNYISEMKVYQKSLYTLDLELKRLNVFSLDSLSLAHTLKFRLGAWSNIKLLHNHSPVNFYVLNNRTLLVQFFPEVNFEKNNITQQLQKRSKKDYYFKMDLKGRVVSDQITQMPTVRRVAMKFHGKTFVSRFDFYEKSLLTTAKNGDIYTARSRDFLIKQYNAVGQYQHAFYYPYLNSRLYKKKIIKRYNFGYPNAALTYVKKTNLPKTWPALHSMRIDDAGRLWISTIVDNKKVYQWWVLRKSGKLIGRFLLSSDEKVQDVRNGYLYTQKFNHKKDHQEIIKYKIHFKKNE